MFQKLTLFQFDRIGKLLERNAGFRYHSNNRFVLESRLRRLLFKKRIGLDSYLQKLNEGEEPISSLIEALTIHETYFFREIASLNALIFIVKRLLARKTGTVKILCAGCSTGEEGYSVVIKLLEKGVLSDNFSIDCFDISSKAVEIARKGRYGGRSVDRIPMPIIRKYFIKEPGELWVKPFLREKVKFFVHNILDLDKLENKYDIILCRNVLLYFSKEKKELALNLLFDKLHYGGVFFMGKTESTGDIDVGFKKRQIMNTKYYVKE